MAQEFLDDFTSYGTDAGRVARMLNGVYADVSRTDLIADPDPTAGGSFVASKFGGGLGGDLRKVLSAPQSVVGVAARYWYGSLPTDIFSTVPVFASFRDANNKAHLNFVVNASGQIVVYRVDAGSVSYGVQIAQTDAPYMVANAWRHLETKVVFDPTGGAAGSIEVRMEGVQILYVAGIRTTSNVAGAINSCMSVAFNSCQSAGSTVMNMKHLIVWNGSGTVNNNFYGTCQVYKIIEDGDVSLNWTAVPGPAGFNMINETTPDDDTKYISAPVPFPAAAKFSMTDLPANTTVVRGVMSLHRSRKSDAGDGNVQVGLISASSTGLGGDRPITTAYTYYYDNFDLDPNGNINWTKAAVNALNLQLNRTL